MTNMQVWEIGMIAPFYWLQKIAIKTIPSLMALHLELRRNSYDKNLVSRR